MVGSIEVQTQNLYSNGSVNKSSYAGGMEERLHKLIFIMYIVLQFGFSL